MRCLTRVMCIPKVSHLRLNELEHELKNEFPVCLINGEQRIGFWACKQNSSLWYSFESYSPCISVKKILKGQELTFDYGESFWRRMKPGQDESGHRGQPLTSVAEEGEEGEDQLMDEMYDV